MPTPARRPIASRRGLAVFLAALAILLPAPAAQAIDAPDRKLALDVFLEGIKVGRELIAFHHQGHALVVEDEIDVSVPHFYVMADHYLLRAHEVWRDGALAELTTDVNDYDNPVEVDLEQSAQGLVVRGTAGVLPAPAGLVPSTLWSIEMTKGQPVLDLDSGRILSVHFTEGAVEPLAIGSEDAPARHITASGDLVRELWYASNGLLIREQYVDSKGQLLDFRYNPTVR